MRSLERKVHSEDAPAGLYLAQDPDASEVQSVFPDDNCRRNYHDEAVWYVRHRWIARLQALLQLSGPPLVNGQNVKIAATYLKNMMMPKAVNDNAAVSP